MYFLRFPRSLGGFGCHKFVFTHGLRVGKLSTDKCAAQRSAIVCQANIETFFHLDLHWMQRETMI